MQDPDRSQLAPTTIAGRNQFALWTVVCVAGVLISYAFIDRPLSTFLHPFLDDRRFLVLVARQMAPFVSLVAVVVGVLGVAYLAGWQPNANVRATIRVVLIAAIATCVAQYAKDELKLMVGRTWPETIFWHNLSWNANGVSLFRPFFGGLGYEAFPSGHTALAMAAASVFACAFPRQRILWMTPVALLAFGLVVTDVHWLSDVIAGAYVGGVCGFGIARLIHLEPVVFEREEFADEAEADEPGPALEPGTAAAREPAE
jgi:membrane-associated phospholipid phosphatase